MRYGATCAIAVLNCRICRRFVIWAAAIIFGSARTAVRLANPFATDLVGTDISGLTDENGVEYGLEIRNAGRRGDWVSYLFREPLTGGERQKHSFVKRYDGLVFGSGYYGDGEDM